MKFEELTTKEGLQHGEMLCCIITDLGNRSLKAALVVSANAFPKVLPTECNMSVITH